MTPNVSLAIAQAMGLVTYAHFTREIGMQLKARKN